MNYTPFAVTFLRSTVSHKWAKHKHCHKSATLITWPEFKTFFQKDYGDPQTFVDSIWSMFRKESQYKLKEAWDYASYLQYLLLILVEFGTIGALIKPIILCYFQESLKLSIKVKIEKQDQALISFEELVQRAVNAEVKAGLRSSIIIRDSDAHYVKGHCPLYNNSSKM